MREPEVMAPIVRYSNISNQVLDIKTPAVQMAQTQRS